VVIDQVFAEVLPGGKVDVIKQCNPLLL